MLKDVEIFFFSPFFLLKIDKLVGIIEAEEILLSYIWLLE